MQTKELPPIRPPTDEEIIKFNTDFERDKAAVKLRNNIIDEEKLAEMANNNMNNKYKYISQYTISELLIGLKNTWFDIMDDLLLKKFVMQTFTKGYRLYFIGMTFVILGIIIYLYNWFDTNYTIFTEKWDTLK